MTDYRRIQCELLKAIRGNQSQLQLAKRLGFKGNQPYRWEKGLQAMSWVEFVHLCKLKKLNLRRALDEHLQFTDDPLDLKKLFPKLIPLETTQSEIARSIGVSRITVARWKQGVTDPNLVHVLGLVDIYRMALIEFLDTLLPDKVLPSLEKISRVREAEKKVTYETPYASAVIRALEIEGYRLLDRHEIGWVARRVGITRAQEVDVLENLSRCGLVRIKNGKYYPVQRSIDTRGNAEGLQAIRSYWASRALARIHHSRSVNAHEHFGHNVYSISRHAQKKLDQEYFRFFETSRAIIENDSEPATEVCVLQVQMFNARDLGEA